jgi:hypothetical protein
MDMYQKINGGDKMARTQEWTEAQWDAYEAEMVTVPIPLLDSLMLAVNIVARGTRVEKNDRGHWNKLEDEVQQYISQVEEKIDKAA